MKHKILLLVLIISLCSFAQEKKAVFYYTTSTAYINGSGKKAIITDVNYTSCFSNTYSSKTPIELQLNEFLKSKYQKYYEYSNIVWVFNSREEAIRERRKHISNYEYDNYLVTKDTYFKFYCNN